MVRMLGKIDNQSLPGSQASELYTFLFLNVCTEPPILRKRLKDSGASVDAIDLAVKLLAINPADRPKAHEALKDQYFVNSPQPDGNILQFLPKTLKIS